MIRLFVAIEVPQALREELRTLQGGVPGARWVAPENFHLTLRFVGEVDNALASDIDAALAQIGSIAFELALRGVGYFGDGGRLRVLYAGVESNPALEHLRQKVDGALARAGLRPDGRRYTPHVTLARFAGRQQAGHHLAQFMASHSLWRAEPFEVEHFTLFSSVTREEGSLYRAEARYPLQVFAE